MQGLDSVLLDKILPYLPTDRPVDRSSIIHPDWARLVEIFAFTLVIIFLLFSNHAKNKALAFLSLLFLIIAEVFLLSHFNIWLKLVLPITLLFFGYVFSKIINHLKERRGKQKQGKIDSAEKAFTIGQAFHQQGHLDGAFEKFKSCPNNSKLMEAMYQLAQDYEKKQRYKKAISVYQYMEEFDADFRDLKYRKASAEQQVATTNFVPDNPSSATKKSKKLLPGSTLNHHFKLDKEIGKGATGTVYLGHDLRSGQQLAIKTLPLADEFNESEVDAVRRRFFREAETAGQLNHPNIVKIHNAGEDQGLAYIAMELLSGHDLTRYTKKDKLLAPVLVMGIVFKAARAMHYAHSKQVIHRDIKPANIMFDQDKRKIIMTDFGIARLIDASRTRTGIILGTPAYMSPEQLGGSKIDGRSDLFALGVMLFQLLTGELPFKGESLAMLMYMIANEPHRDIFKLKPELAQSYPGLAAILDKALEKKAEDRFKNGHEMAEALKHCAKK